jgi:uncharacterized DUF497 family protein
MDFGFDNNQSDTDRQKHGIDCDIEFCKDFDFVEIPVKQVMRKDFM